MIPLDPEAAEELDVELDQAEARQAEREAEADLALLTQLDRRAKAAAVVARVREAAHARRDHTASETVDGVRVAVLSTGAWSVTGHDRRIRVVTDQIAAIHAVVALLAEVTS